MNTASQTPSPTSPLPIFGLTAAFFCTGTLFFLIGLSLSVYELPGLVTEKALHSPAGILIAHLFLLGWATSIAMGASYQLSQVILHVSLYSRALGFVHYGLYTAGVAILLVSFPGWHTEGIAAGASLAASGILAYAINLIGTYRHAVWRNPIVMGSCLSLAALLMTAVLGAFMGLAQARGWTPARYSLIVGTHMWFGIAGWLGGLVLAYEFKLLPMFFISKKKPGWESWTASTLYQAGVWLAVWGQWQGVRLLAAAGAWLVAAGVAVLLLFAWEVRRKSNAKVAIGPIRVIWWQLPAITALAAGWAVVCTGTGSWPSYRLTTTFIVLLVPGWFAATIMGYLSRIVPFLWWAYRFRTREQKKNAVQLANMVPYRPMTIMLVGYLAGIVLTAAANWLRNPGLTSVGLSVGLVAVIVYFVLLGRVFRY